MVGPNRLAASVTLAAAIGAASALAAQPPAATDNDAVLAHWARLTLGAPPKLVQVGAGRTRVEWTAQAAADLYSQSSTGGAVLTPVRSGEFYRVQAAAQMRGEDERGDATWLQLGYTQSNDRAVVPFGHQFNLLQLGWTSGAASMRVGDVVVAHSALGAATALRGVLVHADAGRVQLSGAAGAIAESWEALSDPDRRLQVLRNAYALKTATAVAEGATAYATLQGFADDQAADDQALTAPASSNAATLGLSAARGRLALELEAGASRWRQAGAHAQTDRALRVDAAWRLDSMRLSAGHHDLGRYYSALSAQALPGVKESYVNLGWAAASWLTLTADLRRSEHRVDTAPPVGALPGGPLASGRVRTARLQATLVSQSVPGLSGSLAALRGLGTQADGGEHDRHGVDGQVSFANARWNTSASARAEAVSTGSAATSGRTRAWNASLTRLWPEGFSTPLVRWSQASLGLSANLLSQQLDAGPSSVLRTYTLSASGDATWGRLTAHYSYARGSDTSAGRLAQDSVQFEVSRPLAAGGALKLYSRSTRYVAGAIASYREAIVGLQLSYSF